MSSIIKEMKSEYISEINLMYGKEISELYKKYECDLLTKSNTLKKQAKIEIKKECNEKIKEYNKYYSNKYPCVDINFKQRPSYFECEMDTSIDSIYTQNGFINFICSQYNYDPVYYIGYTVTKENFKIKYLFTDDNKIKKINENIKNELKWWDYWIDGSYRQLLKLKPSEKIICLQNDLDKIKEKAREEVNIASEKKRIRLQNVETWYNEQKEKIIGFYNIEKFEII